MSLITIYEDEDYRLRVEMFQDQVPFLHFDVWNFSLSVYKKMWEQWPTFLDSMKELGFSEVFSLIPKDDEEVLKFQTMFGLEPKYEVNEHVVHSLEL